MFLLGVAEYAQPDVDLSLAKRLVPILWIVDAFVSELPGSRRHPFAKRFGKALQRISRDAEGLKTGVADPDRNPGIRRVSPTRGGIDIRCQPAQEPAARLSIVDAQKHVGAEVRRRPLPEDGRLDLMQLDHRRVRRNIPADGFLCG